MTDTATATTYFVSRQAECMIVPLWKQGKDTLDIARALALPEYEIANHLSKLLEQERASRMPALSSWTDERTERLKKFWANGFSAAQIAAEMGLTRNMVCGKVFRLGITAPPKPRAVKDPEKQRQKMERANERRRQERRMAFSHPTPPYRPTRPTVCEEVTPRNISLIDLEPNDCRWPYGDGPFVHCGLPKFHGSYCASHWFASTGPGTASEQTADRAALHLTGAA